MVVVGLFGLVTALFVYGMVDTTSLALRRDNEVAATFAQAKQALIGRAVVDQNRPGSLLCPDIDNDGVLTLNVDYFSGGVCASLIGRLPWRTLGLPDLRDDAGERLWYALSDLFSDNAGTGPINSDTQGNRIVHLDSTAVTLTSTAVAVIFAPGAALGTQNRDTAATALCPTTGTTIARNLCAANYLEATGGANNATVAGPYIVAQRSATFNDRLFVLTTAELMPPVEQRVARELRTILQAYKTNTACACTNLGGTAGCYPWADLSNGYSDADPYDPGSGNNRGRIPAFGASPYNWGSNPCGTAVPTLPAWFVNNDWRLVVYYTAGQNFLGPDACTTCVDATLTVNGVSGREVVILMPGPNLGAAPRAPVPTNDLTYWSYYFENAENQDNSNDWLVSPSSTAYARDRIYTIP